MIVPQWPFHACRDLKWCQCPLNYIREKDGIWNRHLKSKISLLRLYNNICQYHKIEFFHCSFVHFILSIFSHLSSFFQLFFYRTIAAVMILMFESCFTSSLMAAGNNVIAFFFTSFIHSSSKYRLLDNYSSVYSNAVICMIYDFNAMVYVRA